MALPDGSAMVLSRRIEVLQTSLATIWGFECSRGGREVRPGVWVAFTDAAAGNLALHVGDNPVEVRRRRGDIEAAVGLGSRPFQYMNQVHGSEVACVGAATAAGTTSGMEAPTADAMVSFGEPLAVMVADCVPIVLVETAAAAERPVLAVVHAGRPGVASGVVPVAVARMRALGADGARRLDRPVRLRRAATRSPGTCATTWPRVFPRPGVRPPAAPLGLDLPAAVRSQLQDAGVSVEYSGGCTLEDDTLFSYRRDPNTGRFAGLRLDRCRASDRRLVGERAIE